MQAGRSASLALLGIIALCFALWPDQSITNGLMLTGASSSPYHACHHGRQATPSADPLIAFCMQVGDPTGASLPVPFELAGSARSVVLMADTGLLADVSDGVDLPDASDAEHPTVLTAIPADRAYHVAPWDTVLFVASGSGGLHAWDVSPPDSPVYLTSLLTGPNSGHPKVLYNPSSYIYCGGNDFRPCDICNRSVLATYCN